MSKTTPKLLTLFQSHQTSIPISRGKFLERNFSSFIDPVGSFFLIDISPNSLPLHLARLWPLRKQRLGSHLKDNNAIAFLTTVSVLIASHKVTHGRLVRHFPWRHKSETTVRRIEHRSKESLIISGWSSNIVHNRMEAQARRAGNYH